MRKEIYITERTREAIRHAAEKRGVNEINECCEDLREKLLKYCLEIEAMDINGEDFIIYTPDRLIGKTEAALEIADAAQMPYLVESHTRGIVERIARQRGYKIKFIMPHMETLNGLRIRTIIKDELLPIEKARTMTPRSINIIGIEQI